MISDWEAKLLGPGDRIATNIEQHWIYGTIERLEEFDFIFVSWNNKTISRITTSNPYLSTVCQNCGRVRDEHVLQLPNYKCLFGSTMYRGLYQPKEPRDGEANSP